MPRCNLCLIPAHASVVQPVEGDAAQYVLCPVLCMLCSAVPLDRCCRLHSPGTDVVMPFWQAPREKRKAGRPIAYRCCTTLSSSHHQSQSVVALQRSTHATLPTHTAINCTPRKWQTYMQCWCTASCCHAKSITLTDRTASGVKTQPFIIRRQPCM